MSILQIFKPMAEAQPAVERLEDVLTDLARYGRPRVGMYSDDGTWLCAMDVNISPIGAKFEVRSDFKQTTPMAAAQQCRERLHAAIKSLGGHA